MNNYNFINLSDDELKKYLKKVSDSFNLFHQEIKFDDVDSVLFNKIKLENSVTLYGGTFNPLHEGHLECIRQCPEKNIVVILDRNPQKNNREISLKNEIVDIVNKLKNYSVSIYPEFWISNTKNPTASWISNIIIPEVNLLMGDDSFMSFFTWEEPEIVLKKLTKIYVVPRNFSSNDFTEQIQKMKLVNRNLEINILDSHPFQDISSSKIRGN